MEIPQQNPTYRYVVRSFVCPKCQVGYHAVIIPHGAWFPRADLIVAGDQAAYSALCERCEDLERISKYQIR